MSATSLVLLGQLLGISFAAGLNLYATVALLGLAAHLGWFTLPVELQGLQNILIIGSAAGLYIVEFVVDKLPYIDSLWDALHTFIRPTAAVLLAVAALASMPLEIRILGALLAGGVALVAHGTKAGLRLLSATPSVLVSTTLSILEDIVAIGLAIVALRYAPFALALAGSTLALAVLFGPRLWRACIYGLRALRARVRRLVGESGWHGPDELPRDLRALLDFETFGVTTPRLARATMRRGRGIGAFRNGWLTLAGDTPVFLYHARFRARRLVLDPARRVTVRPGIWADLIEIEAQDASYSLLLLKDGPTPELALAGLVPAGGTLP